MSTARSAETEARRGRNGRAAKRLLLAACRQVPDLAARVPGLADWLASQRPTGRPTLYPWDELAPGQTFTMPANLRRSSARRLVYARSDRNARTGNPARFRLLPYSRYSPPGQDPHVVQRWDGLTPPDGASRPLAATWDPIQVATADGGTDPGFATPATPAAAKGGCQAGATEVGISLEGG